MEKIELRKARDFGQLFNDSIAFLRVNFKSFFGTIVFLAGPFVMLTGLLAGFLQYVSMQLSFSNRLNGIGPANIFSGNSVSTLCIYGIIFLLTTLVTNASVALYFKLYDQTATQDLPIQRNAISPLLAAASWRLFYNLLLLGIVMSVFSLALVAVFYVLGQAGVFNVIIGLTVFVAFIIFIPPLTYTLIIANFIVIRDEILITAAIGKAWRYMRGSFWQTWILIFCVIFSLSMLYMIFNAPTMILTVVNTFTRRSAEAQSLSSATNNSLWYMAFGALSTLGGMLVISPILTCFCVFNFYNHEERHEGTSLLSRIDTFDKN